MSTATAEVIRRWKNTSTLLSRRTFEEITLDYSDDLTAMGFSEKWRRNILSVALEGYMKVCHSETRNRPGASTRMKRRRKKLVGDSDWYSKKITPEITVKYRRQRRKRMPENEQKRTVTESVMFIPHTLGSR